MKIESNYTNFGSQIKPNCLPSFGHAYIDMHSLNSIYRNKPIIRALKEQNTPFRKFIKEVINTAKFEKYMGDCFIKFDRKKYPVEGETFADVDILQILFPQKQEQAKKELFYQLEHLEPNPRFAKYEEKIRKIAEKSERDFIEKQIPRLAEKESSFCAMFNDGSCTFDWDYPNPTHEELVNYIKGSKIVKDLTRRIQYIQSI